MNVVYFLWIHVHGIGTLLVNRNPNNHVHCYSVKLNIMNIVIHANVAPFENFRAKD